jgi:antimicrobial peptide system SdpB family protein
LFLIPITLADPRRTHWSPPPPASDRIRGIVSEELARSTLFVLRLQVAAIYFHAAVGKMRVTEWTDGTAVYYWFTHALFGAPSWLESFVVRVLSVPDVVVAVTWGVILLELLLFIAVAIDRRWWPPLLVLGLAFHSGIVLVHGLVSFFFAMAGALLLYLRATDRPFTLPRVGWSRPRILAVLRLPGIRVAPVELPPVVTR